MTYTQTCPRCGRDIVGDNRDVVADQVVEHARVEHGHLLSPEIVLAHLDGVSPDQ